MSYEYPQAVRDALAVHAHAEQLTELLGGGKADFGLALNLLTVAAIRTITIAIQKDLP